MGNVNSGRIPGIRRADRKRNRVRATGGEGMCRALEHGYLPVAKVPDPVRGCRSAGVGELYGKRWTAGGGILGERCDWAGDRNPISIHINFRESRRTNIAPDDAATEDRGCRLVRHTVQPAFGGDWIDRGRRREAVHADLVGTIPRGPGRQAI